MSLPWEQHDESGTLAGRLLEICDELVALREDASAYGIDASEAEQLLLTEREAIERELFGDG